MKEGPLVAFTPLAQTAAGAYCVFAGAQLALGAAGPAEAVYLNRAALLFVLGLAVLAMLISFLHLGTPQKAYRALLNVRSSWLSREIFSVSLFSACVAIQAGYSLLGDPAALSPLVLLVTCAAAIALVLCISRVYMLRTMPAWNSWSTPLSFFSASLAGGSVAALVLLSAQGSLAASGRPDSGHSAAPD